jgi:hypothetical protein
MSAERWALSEGKARASPLRTIVKGPSNED